MKNGSSDNYKLELVQVLFRHGDRTPDKSEMYPMDPYKESDFKPFGFGQLTNAGKKRAYKLGELLRDRYGSFLGEYEPEYVHAHSTFYNRCKMSLQLVLAGLFPPSPELIWNHNLMWNPIPIDYVAPEQEVFYFPFRNPRFPELTKEAFESPKIKEKIDKYEKTLDYLSDKTGLSKKFRVLPGLYQNLEAKKGLGFPDPDWCDDNLMQELKVAQEILFEVFTHSLDLKKLMMARFLEKVLSNIEKNNDKSSNVKIYLYSAHDLTVHAFLRAHNIYEKDFIEYSGTVALEKLRGSDDRLYVRLLFWPGEGEKFETLKLNGFDELCPYEEYLKIVEPVLYKEGEDDGGPKNGEKVTWYAHQ